LDVLRFESEIRTHLTILETELVTLEEKMHGVEITCPDYTITHWDESTYTINEVGRETNVEEMSSVSMVDLDPTQVGETQ